MTKEQYDKDPVFYCKNCLSLRIRNIKHIDNSEYCDECGSTDVGKSTIEEWNNIYINRYGHAFLNKNYK